MRAESRSHAVPATNRTYSFRKATTGFIAAARRAGSQHANNPTAVNNTVITTYTNGSLGATPYKIGTISLLTKNATGSPIVRKQTGAGNVLGPRRDPARETF